MHGVMIAIVQAGQKKYFNLWCVLGWLLLRQSHMAITCMYVCTPMYDMYI